MTEPAFELYRIAAFFAEPRPGECCLADLGAGLNVVGGPVQIFSPTHTGPRRQSTQRWTMIRRLFVFALFLSLASSLVLTASTAVAAPPPGTFFQGFEKDRDGWFDSTNGGIGTLVRRQSGYSNGGGYADGIASFAGRWHARLTGECSYPAQDCSGPFTRWGGYTGVFPPGGYLTEVAIYLDVGWAASHPDARFDWSSAINQKDGPYPAPQTHRRDWVFNVGAELPTQAAGFWINASTNAFRGSSFPENPCPNPPDPIANPPLGCRTPVFINQSGWYVFRHTFTAGLFAGCPDTACLIVDFDVSKRTGASVAHWTIHSNQDPMSLVGGNRYGWFANQEIPDLPIDNSLRTGVCRKGDGDGDDEDQDGHHHHSKFHGDKCDNRGGNVSDDDKDSGKRFESTSIASSTFTVDEDSQTLTIIGTGLDDGVPVGFTMVAIDFNGAAPAVFNLTLTDGRTVIGTFLDGIVTIE
jgi:hypothetical protein